LELVVDAKPSEGSSHLVSLNAPLAAASRAEALYQSPNEALKAVREDYFYWTGKLTDTSLQLSYAMVAANWAVFGSVDKLLNNFWSMLSVSLVIVGLGLSVVTAKWMGELNRARIDYAETDLSRWEAEFRENARKRVPWPFTRSIESLGRAMREARTWLPLIAGVSFFIALVWR
jgi:hypothetical protein